MKKYRDYAIITIDDDIIYSNDLIETLYNSYIKNPNCIHSRNVDKIMIKNNKVLPYEKWIKQYTFELRPSFYLFSNTVGGTLFPPNILNISNENIKQISRCIKTVDIYLKYLSKKKNIRIVWVPNNFSFGLKQIKDFKNQKYDLYKIKRKRDRFNDDCLKIYPFI